MTRPMSASARSFAVTSGSSLSGGSSEISGSSTGLGGLTVADPRPCAKENAHGSVRNVALAGSRVRGVVVRATLVPARVGHLGIVDDRVDRDGPGEDARVRVHERQIHVLGLGRVEDL